MFSIIDLGCMPGAYYNIQRLKWKEQNLCTIVPWGFHSCACKHLQNFGMYAPVDIDVDAMFQFLDNSVPRGEYKPKEYYFMLSGSQLDPTNKHGKMFHDMVAHPNVIQVDRFTNKSHDSKGVNLFRFSESKDFVFPLENK